MSIATSSIFKVSICLTSALPIIIEEAMPSSSGMSARNIFILFVLPNTLPFQSIRLCPQLASCLVCGFHLLGVSVCTLLDAFTSSINGLDVEKYANTPHKPKGVLSPSPGK
eukprot:15338242-Ditylum_brightwellii.AAC.2